MKNLILLSLLFLFGGGAAHADALQVSRGGKHTCAIKTGGALYCWGNDDSGQLGDGTHETVGGVNVYQTAPVAVPGMSSGVTAVSAGFQTTCAIKGGDLYCWGYNWWGQAGNSCANTCADVLSPTLIPSPPWTSGTVTAVSVGYEHTCAIAAGVAYCWGSNANGALGIGVNYPVYTIPAAVDMPSDITGALKITAGNATSCAVVTRSTYTGTFAYCWGFDPGTGVAQGTNLSPLGPLVVQHPGPMHSTVNDTMNVMDIKCDFATYNGSNCVIRTLSSGGQYFYGWGLDVGNGTSNAYTTPIQAPLHTSSTSTLTSNIDAGMTGGCFSQTTTAGVTTSQCWDSWNQTPIAVGGGITPTGIVGGAKSGCGISSIPSVPGSAKQVYCWGDNDLGQLGDGNLTFSSSPVISGYGVVTW